MTLGTRTPSPRVKSSESPPSRPLTVPPRSRDDFSIRPLKTYFGVMFICNLPSYRFPIQKQLTKTNHRPTVVCHLPAEDTLFGAPQCILVSEYHSHDLISKIFVISFQLWNTSSVVRVLLCSTARWWVREACHRAGEWPCVPTGLVLSGAWHTIQCLAAQPELQASKHFHWIKESSAQTDRQTALKCQSWCSGGEMHTDNEIPIGLFLSCSGQLPPISSFQNDATGQISLSLPSNRW